MAALRHQRRRDRRGPVPTREVGLPPIRRLDWRRGAQEQREAVPGPDPAGEDLAVSDGGRQVHHVTQDQFLLVFSPTEALRFLCADAGEQLARDVVAPALRPSPEPHASCGSRTAGCGRPSRSVLASQIARPPPATLT